MLVIPTDLLPKSIIYFNVAVSDTSDNYKTSGIMKIGTVGRPTFTTNTTHAIGTAVLCGTITYPIN